MAACHEHMHEVEVKHARRWRKEGEGISCIAGLLQRDVKTIRRHVVGGKQGVTKTKPKGCPRVITKPVYARLLPGHPDGPARPPSQNRQRKSTPAQAASPRGAA